MKVAILYGGRSSEHEVSVVSASSVVRNINAAHEVVLVWIDRDGAFWLQDAAQIADLRAGKIGSLSMEKTKRVAVLPNGAKCGFFVVEEAKTVECDVVFPVMHGQFSEDGAMQGLLEMMNVAFVGGGVLASAVSFDKEKTKIICKNAGLPIVDYVCVKKCETKSATFWQDLEARIEAKFTYPVFVKPCSAGSSVGAKKVPCKADLRSVVEAAFLIDEKVLLEKFINAREIETAVLGNDCAKCFEPGEIAATHDFYDYDAKYNDPNGAKIIVRAELDDATREKIKSIALAAFSALDLSGFSRVDFFVDKGTGEIFLNEVNTIPGFTSISMYPKICEAGGLAFCDLIDDLLRLAVERFAEKSMLKTTK